MVSKPFVLSVRDRVLLVWFFLSAYVNHFGRFNRNASKYLKKHAAGQTNNAATPKCYYSGNHV